MNCQEFNELLNELASDRLLDALARKRALVHAGGCETCARQLAAQRALTAGLIEFADLTSRELPPARIKQQLRAAVAERRVAPTAAPVSATVLPFKPAAKWSWQRQALAAAASILVLLTGSTLLWRNSISTDQTKLAALATPSPAVAPVVQESPLGSPAAVVASQVAQQRQSVKRRQVRRARVVEPETDEQELASEFVPLTLDTDERALANGTLVRLEVSRARLIAMGLPLRIEADRDTINAEVMMGDNGVAYAIRVVR